MGERLLYPDTLQGPEALGLLAPLLEPSPLLAVADADAGAEGDASVLSVGSGMADGGGSAVALGALEGVALALREVETDGVAVRLARAERELEDWELNERTPVGDTLLVTDVLQALDAVADGVEAGDADGEADAHADARADGLLLSGKLCVAAPEEEAPPLALRDGDSVALSAVLAVTEELADRAPEAERLALDDDADDALPSAEAAPVTDCERTVDALPLTLMLTEGEPDALSEPRGLRLLLAEEDAGLEAVAIPDADPVLEPLRCALVLRVGVVAELAVPEPPPADAESEGVTESEVVVEGDVDAGVLADTLSVEAALLLPLMVGAEPVGAAVAVPPASDAETP